jgi:alpha-glucosidase
VASESANPDSVLNFYRHLLTLRHHNRALLDGNYEALNQDDPNVISYLRHYGDQAVLVALNMSVAPQKMRFNLQPQGFASPKVSTLLSTGAHPGTDLSALSLEPFGVYIAEITR